MTVAGYGPHYIDDEGNPFRDEFPAIVIRNIGTKALVFIQPGITGRGGDEKFEASNGGFCKIPLSRISPRDGPREVVCWSCNQPESLGHIEGYSCAFKPGEF